LHYIFFFLFLYIIFYFIPNFIKIFINYFLICRNITVFPIKLLILSRNSLFVNIFNDNFFLVVFFNWIDMLTLLFLFLLCIALLFLCIALLFLCLFLDKLSVYFDMLIILGNSASLLWILKLQVSLQFLLWKYGCWTCLLILYFVLFA
jgi:hypothetical protein